MKSWREDISQHIQHWENQLGNLGWWPRYIYHFTDVQNAARILSEGVLYSRYEATNRNRMVVDNASPEIIKNTDPVYTHFVRLYFRPRTPTQYCNEGIRPLENRELGAHCPVPIYFCFDALELLSQDNVEFSDGNMASPRAIHNDTRELFLNIPFHYVYHNGAFPPTIRDEIIFRRNAEVLVPEKLGFAHLVFIACRSEAERQTLLHLLPKNKSNKIKRKVRLGEQGFFERRWTHVEEVVAINHEIIFRLNPSTQIPGPFDIRVEYVEHGKESPWIFQKRIEELGNNIKVKLNESSWGEIKFFLDDSLAFCDEIFLEDIPF